MEEREARKEVGREEIMRKTYGTQGPCKRVCVTPEHRYSRFMVVMKALISFTSTS